MWLDVSILISGNFNPYSNGKKAMCRWVLKPTLNALKYDNKVTIKELNQKISEYGDKNVLSNYKKCCHIFPVNFQLELKIAKIKSHE